MQTSTRPDVKEDIVAQPKMKPLWNEEQVVFLDKLALVQPPNPPGKNEPDEKALDEALEAVGKAVKNDNTENRPVLLHIGVGVGDPKSTLKDLNNPSADEVTSLSRKNQVNPPYLVDEVVQSCYYVVALNFNEPDGTFKTEPFGGKAQGIHLQVTARFPLATGDRLEKLGQLLSIPNLQRVVVCNSISQHHYQGIVIFARRAWNALKKLQQTNPVSYVHFAYSKYHTTYAITSPKLAVAAEEDTLLRFESVFLPGSG